MLEALRRGAQHWLAKVLFAILVASFAIWGVADVFRGYGAGELARIGSVEITSEQFRQEYQSQLEEIRRRFGGRVTPEQARQFGLPNQVLSRLVGSAAIDSHARQLKLGISDKAIVDAIQREPAFQGMDGKFSRLAFDGYMRQLGLSEAGFVALKRKDEVREQITDAILKAVVVPKAMLDATHRYADETRKAQHFTIDAEKSVKVADPTDPQIAETYEKNKSKFVYPEYRKLAVLLLTIDGIKQRIAVGDDEVKAFYEQDKERYNEPERRHIYQIAFKDRAAAEAAVKALAAGKSFADVAKEAGAKESDIDLGVMAKKDFVDPKIADAAFALAKDKTSDVVEGRFATVVLRVGEIIPGKTKTLDDVKGEIRDRLAVERAAPEIQKLHDQVDDARSTGKTLKEIAETLKLKYVEVPATDQTGKAPDGKPAFEGPDGRAIVSAAFDAKAGVENEAVETSDGGYAWVDLLGTTPQKQKELADVKDDVKALWLDTERRKAVGELARKLVERARAGDPMETLAKEAGGKLETTQPFKRNGATAGLPASAVAQAFAVPRDGATSTESEDGKSRIVLKVTEVIEAPALSKLQADTLEATLQQQMQTDAVSEYVAALQERLGVSINQAELRRVLGIDQQQ